jgi:DNA-3-methyladenine glycosylase I
MNEKVRCSWAGNIPIYIDYHDNEWGRPEHDDVKLFEMLILESMQAGLSWITVLKKREAFREAFEGFDPNKVVLYDETKIQELMRNEKIIRNSLKINAAIINARVFLNVVEQHGSFDEFIWNYVDYMPITGHWKKLENIPATTPLSDKISRDLKKMGFKFVGSTTIYSFMQAIGMVNDHITDCFVYEELLKGQPYDKKTGQQQRK